MFDLRRATRLAIATLALPTVAVACGGQTDSNGESVTVYTGRHYGIEAVFDEFTEATGIEVRFTTGSDPELRERLLAEGDNTPADLVMTADAANIELASQAGLFAAVDSNTLTSAIPAELRSPDNTWFALSRRLRVIMYSTERVSEPPTSYAALGDSEWSGKLCLRPSTHPYTQSLVASLILHLGDDEALKVVESWVANDPLYINSDTDILEAIAAGDCDVALANTYYLPRLLADDPAFPVAISWPDQDSNGAHVNVSAAGVTKSAPNRAGAIRLLEWLATKGQSTFSDANFEYPADPSVAPASALSSFGDFVADLAAVRELGRLNPRAVEVLSAAGYE
ncbi:MAG: Fe(3+) ABC transporter substrate-binding protein [Acidimicrobiales bacterium mtb01]|nr:extracellular solute-binding protein [Actinomycetota bacterium]TEX45671.1 MAG: Fe(3+) ABC transporter substrate-binding protein [Acidimicrobiales bacterium mtb01]